MRNDSQRTSIRFLANYFIKVKDAENLASGSLRFYQQKLENFTRYCEWMDKTDIFSINEEDIRDYLLQLKTDHKPGGVHAFFRAVHAFFTWFDAEYEPDNWKNPIRKIKAPKVPDEILDPVSAETVTALLKACDKTQSGIRDRAMIMLLDNTGLRASELLMLDLVALDLPLSVLYVEQGKGGYPRAVDFDRDTKRAIKAYLNVRPRCDTNAIFISRYRERLTYDGLRSVITYRAKLAGVKPAMLHAFRRKHVLDMYRAGEGELTIQKRIGHRDGKTIHRYIKLSREDLRNSARRTNKNRH